MGKERFYLPPFLKWHVSKIAAWASTEDLSTKKKFKMISSVYSSISCWNNLLKVWKSHYFFWVQKSELESCFDRQTPVCLSMYCHLGSCFFMFQVYIWDALVIHHLPSEGLIWWTHFMPLVLFLYPPSTHLKIYGVWYFQRRPVAWNRPRLLLHSKWANTCLNLTKKQHSSAHGLCMII